MVIGLESNWGKLFEITGSGSGSGCPVVSAITLISNVCVIVILFDVALIWKNTLPISLLRGVPLKVNLLEPKLKVNQDGSFSG